ncbi:MAG: hypothetical protein AAGE89_09720 [Pseudomonadota bacterium]
MRVFGVMQDLADHQRRSETDRQTLKASHSLVESLARAKNLSDRQNLARLEEFAAINEIIRHFAAQMETCKDLGSGLHHAEATLERLQDRIARSAVGADRTVEKMKGLAEAVDGTAGTVRALSHSNAPGVQSVAATETQKNLSIERTDTQTAGADPLAMQHVVVSFRLLLRQMGEDAARLRALNADLAKDSLGSTTERFASGSEDDRAALGALLERLETGVRSLEETVKPAANVGDDVSRDSGLQQLLVSLRMTVRSIDLERGRFATLLSGLDDRLDERVDGLPFDDLFRRFDELESRFGQIEAAIEKNGDRRSYEGGDSGIINGHVPLQEIAPALAAASAFASLVQEHLSDIDSRLNTDFVSDAVALIDALHGAREAMRCQAEELIAVSRALSAHGPTLAVLPKSPIATPAE